MIEHGSRYSVRICHNTPTTYYGHNSGVGLALDLCCGTRPRRIGRHRPRHGDDRVVWKGRRRVSLLRSQSGGRADRATLLHILKDSPAHVDVVNGDARVSLAGEPPQRYDVIAVDAFSGDAIPVHLITIQALELYRRHLAPGGIVAFHISNRYLDLAGVVQQIADRAGMKTAFVSSSEIPSEDVFTSDWVLVTSNETFLKLPVVVKAMEPITVPKRLRLWTDDYNSLLPILRIRSDDST